MPKRSIGIDITESHIHAIQIAQNGNRFCIEQSCAIPTDASDDSPVDIIPSLLNQNGFDKRCPIALALPHKALFFHRFETDRAGLQSARRTLKTSMTNDFPVPADTIIADICTNPDSADKQNSFVTAAADQNALTDRLETLTRAKPRCRLADAPVFAIHTSAALNHPEITQARALIIYLDRTHTIIAVTNKNEILITRNLPLKYSTGDDNTLDQNTNALLFEISLTYQKALGQKIPENTKVILTGLSAQCESLQKLIEEKLRCHTIIADPTSNIDCTAPTAPQAESYIAQGLALRALAPDKTSGVNFLKTPTAKTDKNTTLSKQILTTISLVAAIAVVSIVGLFLRLAQLETQYAHIKQNIRKVFQQTLPHEQNIVDELAQMQTHLQTLKKDYTLLAPYAADAWGPLQILHAIETHTPNGIVVNDMVITAQSATLNAACDSFETPYHWQNLLRQVPQFVAVTVQKPYKHPQTRRVHFTVQISLTEEQNVTVNP